MAATAAISKKQLTENELNELSSNVLKLSAENVFIVLVCLHINAYSDIRKLTRKTLGFFR